MPLKVLVIDDHPLVQEGVAAALESLGHDTRVMSARDAEQGMAMAAANPDLDLVLLDLALPGMSGFGLIGRLHERFPSLPVVVLSALEDPENVRQTINSGAMGFVPKSAPTRVLLEVLQQVLEGNVSVPASLQGSSGLSNGSAGTAAAEPPQPIPDVGLLTLRQLEVLVEGPSERPGYIVGTSCRYATVELPGGQYLVGGFVPVVRLSGRGLV